MNTVILNNIVSVLLLPPTCFVLLCFIGWLLRRRWPRFGVTVSATALLLLLIFSTKAGALLLVAPLENRTQVLASTGGAQAIVVLGGGRLANAPEYGGRDIPSYWELARLRYAAKLHRESGLPILVTGGVPEGGVIDTEATIMARTLTEDFSVPVKWLEGASDNTAQNANFSAKILRQENIQHILLVTDAMHMSRSVAAFKRAGLHVLAAPTIFFSHDRLSVLDFIPGGEGLRRSHYAAHEWLGIAWYALRHQG
ncbi:MAG: YdcF family protein [Glaciimonas sp.]|nr:YdcF family protein [Glaciimonas sp.]